MENLEEIGSKTERLRDDVNSHLEVYESNSSNRSYI